MKEIIRHIPKTLYVCDFCNEEYLTRGAVSQCEELHKIEKCEHEFTYRASTDCDYLSSEDSEVYSKVVLNKSCTRCEQVDVVDITLDELANFFKSSVWDKAIEQAFIKYST